MIFYALLKIQLKLDLFFIINPLEKIFFEFTKKKFSLFLTNQLKTFYKILFENVGWIVWKIKKTTI
jgi:hypothetical protein